MIAPMRFLIAAALAFLPLYASAAGTYYTVEYPGSDKPGELIYAATYTLWVPAEVKRIRGVIVHQHGCGVGASKGGQTAAYDLHWQALAKKWDCALMGPSYHMGDGDECRKWCDPRNGSDKTFLRSLDDLAAQARHPEIAQAPWVLWGHSGGGFWSSLMLTLHPERIAAIWFRSGSAQYVWERGDIPKPILTPAVYGVPLMFNGGVKEETDKRHGPARLGDRAMFKAWRQNGAPAGLAPDPRTGHECGDSRYLAIPFLDVCLALRLPETGNELRAIDVAKGWLAAAPGQTAHPASAYEGKVEDALWLPDGAIAKAWAEYLKTGATTDTTPPAAPTGIKATPVAEGTEITWEAEADFESGLQQFIILRNGQEVGRVPEKPAGKFGRPLFQAMSYHDTPEAPLPAMKFLDRTPAAKGSVYRVIAVNSAALRSSQP